MYGTDSVDLSTLTHNNYSGPKTVNNGVVRNQYEQPTEGNKEGNLFEAAAVTTACNPLVRLSVKDC